MRIIGLDYGEKRIGVALSDESGKLAFPYVTVLNTPELFSEIKKICDKESVNKIIVGVPISFSGGVSTQAEKNRKFGEDLEKFLNIPVEYINEIFTSKMSSSAGVKKELLDQSSAAIILQSYLDRH